MAPFGETVLAWRLARGLTQAALASQAGVPRPNLSAIERGDREVTLKTLRALAAALGVRPGQLADGELPRDAAPILGRPELERIARAAARGTATANPHEAMLARALADSTRTRVTGPSARSKGPSGGDRAYFRLRTTAPANVVASLLDRLNDDRGRRT